MSARLEGLHRQTPAWSRRSATGEPVDGMHRAGLSSKTNIPLSWGALIINDNGVRAQGFSNALQRWPGDALQLPLQAASSTSFGVDGCGLFMFASRRDKLGGRPGPAQAKPHPLGWPGASQRRDEAVAALPRYQRKPAMVLALLPRPPLAHRAGRDAFQFAVDCRNAFCRL